MRRGAATLSLVALVLGFTACGGGGSEEIETSAPVPVETKPVHRGTIREVIAVTGKVVPAPGAALTVVAPQAARLQALPVGVGDRVRKGDLLARFEIPALAADESARAADVARSRARLDNARAGAVRLRGLLARGIAARKEVEDAERELAEAEAEVRGAEGALAAARTLAGRREVRAPFAGVVAARWHNPGDLVDAAAADPILQLVDPERLEVEAQVPADAASRVLRGAAARIFGAAVADEAAGGGRGAGGDGWPATVLSAPVAIDPATSSALVRLRPSGTVPAQTGLSVRVEITGRERRDVLLVPATALAEEGSERSVFTLGGDGKVHRHRVEVGLAAGGEVEIVQGLREGERVVARGADGLPDGAAAREAS
jgi:RND family efflux transporter MFP subunit